MKGILAVAIGFLLFPGSVILLLSANFGALKGYLIGAISFFGFLTLLSAVWLFGIPGSLPNLGPKGPDPKFIQFTADSPLAQKYTAVSQFQGGEANGWLAEPPESPTLSPAQTQLKGELEAAKQAAESDLITSTNKTVTDSSKELDVTNLDAKVFYTKASGTTLAAITIAPKEPPAGSGLVKPNMPTRTFFAYRNPGAPGFPSLLFFLAAVVLFAIHVILLGVVERRRPLGATPPVPTAASRPSARV